MKAEHKAVGRSRVTNEEERRAAQGGGISQAWFGQRSPSCERYCSAQLEHVGGCWVCRWQQGGGKSCWPRMWLVKGIKDEKKIEKREEEKEREEREKNGEK